MQAIQAGAFWGQVLVDVFVVTLQRGGGAGEQGELCELEPVSSVRFPERSVPVLPSVPNLISLTPFWGCSPATQRKFPLSSMEAAFQALLLGLPVCLLDYWWSICDRGSRQGACGTALTSVALRHRGSSCLMCYPSLEGALTL